MRLLFALILNLPVTEDRSEYICAKDKGQEAITGCLFFADQSIVIKRNIHRDRKKPGDDNGCEIQKNEKNGKANGENSQKEQD